MSRAASVELGQVELASPQIRLPRCPGLRPDRRRPGPLGHALETCPQRFQYRFRRTCQLICTHTNQTTVTPLMGHSQCRRDRQRNDGHHIGARNSMFTNTGGKPLHPESISQLFGRIVTRFLVRLTFASTTCDTSMPVCSSPVEFLRPTACITRSGFSSCALTLTSTVR